jgi:hypothetical protein
MVIIGSDVLLLAYTFPDDKRHNINQVFLEAIQTARPATTIYNVMEVLGQLSFNLSPAKLTQWQNRLVEAHNPTVVWGVDPTESIQAESWHDELYEKPFVKMRENRMAYMDAMILSLAERTPNVEIFVTWNAKHFKGKSSLPVLTPQEYLERKVL